MSKERAKRRAEREAAAALAAARQQRRARVARAVTAPLAPFRTPFRALAARWDRGGRNTRPAGARPVDSALRRKRSRENGLLLAVLLAFNVVVWLLRAEWGWRLSFLVLSALLWPVLGVLAFDRRSSR